MKPITIAREDLARVQARQRRVTEAMREHQVRHPADLPVAAILALRASARGADGRPAMTDSSSPDYRWQNLAEALTGPSDFPAKLPEGHGGGEQS